jgi:tRNA C32,U32 (ribose-2'-O)-methylase TrmJ
MYGHIREALDQLGFFGTKNPDVMMRRLKGLFSRAETTQREVSIIRGICAAIQGKKRPR